MPDPSPPRRITPQELRSHRWFGVETLRAFGHRSRVKQMGYGDGDYLGKPVIAILNTWSDLNTCHQHMRVRAEEVKRGVWQAGGFPVELPVMSLDEMFMKPTSMLYRNLLAMEVEETLRCHPIDGVVLMGGCDKTTPGLLMGAASVDLPAIFLPAGPMLRGHFRGQTLGSGSDIWKYWDERRAGAVCDADLRGVEEGIARSPGVCMTMGTASTMTSVTDALGMTLPGSSSVPAVDSSHSRVATECGRRIVEMVWQGLRPRQIMTDKAFENAIMVDMAIGGSTNAIIHLIAMAGRAGVKLDLDRFDAISRRVPTIADIRPSGRFLMEDFYYAGGLRALMQRMRPYLHLDCMTVTGRTVGDNVEGAAVHNDEVIRPLDKPLSPEGGTAVLRGNLAPDGCVIKHTAADRRLLRHTGPAIVFSDYNDMAQRIDAPDLGATADSVLVLQSAGPIGAPGMPEWGMLPIPQSLLKQGVRDMVRISDARMSGTSYGTCVLHVCPESHLGGPIALVRTGDMIELDVPARRIHLRINDEELARRRAEWKPPQSIYTRGFGYLFSRHVTAANLGCDFDFLHDDGGRTPEPEIH